MCFTDQVCHDDCVDHCGCVLGAEYKLKAARRLAAGRVVTVTCQGHHTVTGLQTHNIVVYYKIIF